MKNLTFYMLALRAFPDRWASVFSDETHVQAAADTIAPQPPSGLTVQPVAGGLTVSWTNPTLDADGAPCVDLAWIRLYRSTTAGIDIADPASYETATLISGETYPFSTEVTYGAGRYYQCLLNAEGAIQATSSADRGYRQREQTTQYFVVTAIDRSGNESIASGEVSDTPGVTDTVDDNAVHVNVAGEIAAVSEKVILIDDDMFLLNDSEDGDNPKMGKLGNLPSKSAYMEIRLLDKDTDQAVEAGVGGEFRVPSVMTVEAAGAYFDTAGSGAVTTIDINEAGTSILSTKITVDSGEKSSQTAAIAPVVSDNSYAADAILTFDIDAVPGTPGKGLTVWMKVKL